MDVDERRKYSEGRILGWRVNRYSWWTHWRELADYFLPRRYKWLITPNQMARGAPINQHILDSTGVLCARNLASGIMSGVSSPTSRWIKFKIGNIDTTKTSPVSLWLAECQRLVMLVMQLSNFYNSIAVFWYDLVIFGTASQLIYEDYENVINCINPCLGEFYVDIDGYYRPVYFAREFTFTVTALVDRFGIENCSDQVRQLYNEGTGVNRAKEIIVAHIIEPNDAKWGLPKHFKFVEAYWEWSGSTAQQGGGTNAKGFLEVNGFHERPNITGRWDLVSNDPYGRSPGMDALPDNKQLQQEVRRKAQAIDKTVNPPLVADIQLKNQPTSQLPGGITFVSGYTASGKPGVKSIYDSPFPIRDMSEDLIEVRERMKKIFFNDLFLTISQFETRSNVTATEIDARRAEALVMLGPVLERIEYEVLAPAVERIFGIMARKGLLPPAPAEIQGQHIEVEFVSMLAVAQAAAQTSGIERTLGIAGNLAGLDPQVMDVIDTDFALENYSTLMQNDPRLIRAPDQISQIRAARQQQQQQQQQVEAASQLAPAAKNLADINVGGGKTALQQMTGI